MPTGWESSSHLRPPVVLVRSLVTTISSISEGLQSIVDGGKEPPRKAGSSLKLVWWQGRGD
jgi:hypothetical protein